MQRALFFVSALFLAVPLWLGAAAPAAAQALNRWSISCTVDQGAIRHQGNVWTFRTSSNRCSGGIYNQRAEISSDHVAWNHRGDYLFRAQVAMRTESAERFSIFQIHDGRFGCAPPLMIRIEGNGAVEMTSDIKTGEGESCIRGAISEVSRPGLFRRDGTEHDFQVLIRFDGSGAFDATVMLDGAAVVAGRYEIQSGSYRPEEYYFKHGVYSHQMFNYEMVSRGMSVQRVQVN